jgi:hypothetical protein
MDTVNRQAKNQGPPLAERIVLSLPFFALAWWLGCLAAKILRQRYGGPFYTSFGFNFNFGLFRVYEPSSSWFVLICSMLFIWAGCSAARKGVGLRAGAIVGVICFVVIVLGLLAA